MPTHFLAPLALGGWTAVVGVFGTNLGFDVCALTEFLSQDHSARKLIFTVEKPVLQTQSVSHTNQQRAAESQSVG